MNLGKKNRNSIMRIKFFNFSLIILFLTFLNSNYSLANNNEALFGNDDSKVQSGLLYHVTFSMIK